MDIELIVCILLLILLALSTWMAGEYWKEKEHYRCRVFDLTNGKEGSHLPKAPNIPPPVRCYHFDKEANACASPSQTKKHSAWSEEDIKALNRISTILVDASEVKNWWKEYRLIERVEMIRLTNFLKSLIDRIHPQPTEWSEDDENMLNSIIATCELAEQDRHSSPARHLYEMQNNWLKSIKDRVQPQPKQEWSEDGEIDNYQKAK